VCVSTQVGCAVGCPFCATGLRGLRRSCTPAEVVDQVRAAGRALHSRGLGPVTHVVYMGMGEPLAAYDTTVASLRALVGAGGISARRITVSTSGVVPAIHRLAAEDIPCTLAISLHAATDELRDRLVPLNRSHPIASLVDAGTAYARRTGRRLSFEWCLIGDFNDSAEQARGLAALARRAHAHVNVIPMNHIEGSPWGPPDRRAELAFLAELEGITVTVRDTRGADTDAACGPPRATLEGRRLWGDHEGDVFDALSADFLLTSVMLYWVTESIGSTMPRSWTWRSTRRRLPTTPPAQTRWSAPWSPATVR
jgi:23S rRNA (adenine2503-C2)-methyltransferase